MKLFLLTIFIGLSPIGFSQYFNITPQIYVPQDSMFHYMVTGIEDFPDTAVLNIELLSDYETMGLVESRLFDLSDSLTWSGFTNDSITNEFSIDLGLFDVNTLILHMWISISSEKFDEIYFQP